MLPECWKMGKQFPSLPVARRYGDPRTCLDDLRSDPAMKGAVAFPTEIRKQERTVRINITARESQIEEIDRRARAKGLTRSSYIVQSALQKRAASH